MRLLPLLLLTVLSACADSDDDSAAPDDDSGDDDDSTPVGDDDSQADDDSVADDDTVGDDDSVGDDDTTPSGPATFESCFGWQEGPVDYAGIGLVMGENCLGTNHQTIENVEHVVFVGDSVTVGTPPTATTAWYRNLVADGLVDRFPLEAPGVDWQNVDLIDGVTYVQDSGDFSSCAKWGARTDDLLEPPHQQLATCLPEGVRGLRTLVVMTVGGNDLMSMLQDLRDGVDPTTLQAEWEGALADYSEAIHWLKDDPLRFPAGIDVILANNFDVTDGEGATNIAECPGAGWIGLDDSLYDPFVHPLGQSWQRAVATLAVETGSDMIFQGEIFCGYGYGMTPSNRCWRGEGVPIYLDDTCAHPSTSGHAALAEAFLAVVDE
jgi:lysophospholipase L1-like esterase